MRFNNTTIRVWGVCAQIYPNWNLDRSVRGKKDQCGGGLETDQRRRCVIFMGGE